MWYINIHVHVGRMPVCIKIKVKNFKKKRGETVSTWSGPVWVRTRDGVPGVCREGSSSPLSEPGMTGVEGHGMRLAVFLASGVLK